MYAIKEVRFTIEAKRLEKEYKAKSLGINPVDILDENLMNLKKKKPDRKMSMAEAIRDWKGWLKEGSFYVHAIVYMLVRIAVNVTTVSNTILTYRIFIIVSSTILLNLCGWLYIDRSKSYPFAISNHPSSVIRCLINILPVLIQANDEEVQ